jgi:hypothetical protein
VPAIAEFGFFALALAGQASIRIRARDVGGVRALLPVKVDLRVAAPAGRSFTFRILPFPSRPEALNRLLK